MRNVEADRTRFEEVIASPGLPEYFEFVGETFPEYFDLVYEMRELLWMIDSHLSHMKPTGEPYRVKMPSMLVDALRKDIARFLPEEDVK
jgi:hypothetical protein